MNNIHMMQVTSNENYPALQKGDYVACHEISEFCGDGFYVIVANGLHETLWAIKDIHGQIVMTKTSVNYFNFVTNPTEFSELVKYKITHHIKQIDFCIADAKANFNAYLTTAEYSNNHIKH